MTKHLRAYFELVRIPNVFTAVADVLAGYLYGGGDLRSLEQWAPLCAASACLYSAGMALNDAWDAQKDARQRPTRPIPSGRVPRRRAYILGIVLLAGGVLSAMTVSSSAGATSILLVTAIVLYDVVLKSTAIAPVIMGLCRALNLALGLSTTSEWAATHMLPPIAIMWLYITAVTFFAQREAAGGERRRLVIGFAGILLGVCGLAGLPWITGSGHWEVLPVIAVLAIVVTRAGVRAVQTGAPAEIQAAVKTFVCCVILLDACIAGAAGGLLAAACVATLLVPTVFLGRTFRMT